MPSAAALSVISPSLAALMILISGCRQEATRDAVIKTTSPAGTSTAPASNSAQARDVALIRTVYAIPAGSTVDVFADENRMFNALAYRTVTPYREIAADRYSLSLRPAGLHLAEALTTNSERLDAPFVGSLDLRPVRQSETMLSVPSIRLDAGKSYTLIVVGRVRTAPKLDTILVEDEAVPGL